MSGKTAAGMGRSKIRLRSTQATHLRGGGTPWWASAVAIPFLTLGAHAAAGEMGPTPSDWEKLVWSELTTARATLICLSDQPASWCGEWWESRDTEIAEKTPEIAKNTPAAELEDSEPVEKPKAVPDADWEALLHRVSTRPPNPADFETLSLRAKEDADPAAMEVLGYAYAAGWGVEQDYARAYEYYGLAFVAGASHVKPNLDQLWTYLAPEQRQRLKGMFQASASAESL